MNILELYYLSNFGRAIKVFFFASNAIECMVLHYDHFNMD